MQRSWLASANDPASGFPIQNLPYGVFLHQGVPRIGIAIGDSILDLHACASHGLLRGLSDELIAACLGGRLNTLMSLGSSAWSSLRERITGLLDADQAEDVTQQAVSNSLVPRLNAVMQAPAQIGDYTDFYASIHHATRVGKLFRPGNPLLPNYKYVPIGYHGRASSIVLSGEPILRPSGQIKAASQSTPTYAPTQALDYELEVGIFAGPGNTLGQPISITDAEDHIFGLCLVNDWSARDIQSWENQPLGPFLAKSFATTISPWIVPMAALQPFRVPLAKRPEGDPPPLPYLSSSDPIPAVELTLEVFLQSEGMRQTHTPPMCLSRGNLRDLYWSAAQLLTHHTSNGCNLRPGDLLASGTISGPEEGSEGCLLEKTLNPNPIRLPNGELRTFLEDGDQITFNAFAQKPGHPRIGFGPCTGTIFS